ncbi:MAG: hydrolase [Candidatus Xenobia bacterium]
MDTPIRRALLSLDGLSVGDALGERFFGLPEEVGRRIAARLLPPGPWRYTDDTEMALGVVACLQERGGIEPTLLARLFHRSYHNDRGYGRGMHRFMELLDLGVPWDQAASMLFEGRGSFGNGSAMRVAPVGAYFAHDPERAAREAACSAVVTHAHPEAEAGAVAVAVAAALAWQDPTGASFWAGVLDHTPRGRVRERIAQACELPLESEPTEVAARLGSGQEVACYDTVPFCLWCARRHLDDYAEAFWTTVSGLGDRDTTCAIVGGIVALSAPGVPEDWLARRESLP